MKNFTEAGIPTENYQTLYHAFPRRAVSSPEKESSQGLRILESILARGLVITPEIVEWRLHEDRPPVFTARKRACFTALGTGEFAGHARIFGAFAVGFDRSVLEGLGATPVFYVPRHLPDGGKGRNIGSFYIERLLQIQLFLENNPKSFSIGGDAVTTQELSNFTRFLSGLFYPIEDLGDNRTRNYFAQKEWCIQANLFLGKHPLSRPLSKAEKREIESFDREFFQKEMQLAAGKCKMIDQCAIIETIDGVALRDFISHIIAPERDRKAVTSLMEKYGVCVPVIWSEDLPSGE